MSEQKRPPRVGRLAEERHIGMCGYSPEEGDPPCLIEATWHAVVADEHGEPWAMLATCDEHKSIMGGLPTWVHEHDSPCGLPDALFYPDLNLCAVPWVEAEMTMVAAEPIGVRP